MNDATNGAPLCVRCRDTGIIPGSITALDQACDCKRTAGGMKKHPIQPLQMEGDVLRFKRNKIVEFLLKRGGYDLNALHCMDFPAEDWTQFHQLIGYSHSGIPNCSEEVWQAAQAMYEEGISEEEARANHLREELQSLKTGMRNSIARLYGVHPDDLNGETHG